MPIAEQTELAWLRLMGGSMADRVVTFLFGVMAGLLLALIVTSTRDAGPICERTSGDSVWNRKKEVIPCKP